MSRLFTTAILCTFLATSGLALAQSVNGETSTSNGVSATEPLGSHKQTISGASGSAGSVNAMSGPATSDSSGSMSNNASSGTMASPGNASVTTGTGGSMSNGSTSGTMAGGSTTK